MASREPLTMKLMDVNSSAYRIQDAQGRSVATWAGHDDARRIVACFNACVGLSIENIEQAARCAIHLRQERAELRAALQSLVSDFDRSVRSTDPMLVGVRKLLERIPA